MADEKTEDKVVDKKADADAGEKLDKVLAHLDSVASMCDSLSKRMDSYDADRKDAAELGTEKEEKADAEDEDEKSEKDAEDALEEEGKAKPVAADKARKDAKRKDEDEMADKAKKDAEEEKEEARKADAASAAADNADLRKKIADLEARIPKALSDDDFHKMADAQARADAVYNAFGKRAPRPLDGENLLRYRKRLAGELKTYSKVWGKADLNAIARDDTTFGIAEEQIYADAMEAARNPTDLEEGALRAVVQTDPGTGRITTKFHGKHTFIHGMKSPTRRAVGFNLNKH